jgi:hypothetical protein
LKNFIIRIYRQDETDADKVVGIVESVEGETKNRFSSINELVCLLRGRRKTGGITEEKVRQAIRNGPGGSVPDLGEIRFEERKLPDNSKNDDG